MTSREPESACNLCNVRSPNRAGVTPCYMNYQIKAPGGVGIVFQAIVVTSGRKERAVSDDYIDLVDAYNNEIESLPPTCRLSQSHTKYKQYAIPIQHSLPLACPLVIDDLVVPCASGGIVDHPIPNIWALRVGEWGEGGAWVCGCVGA